MKIGTRIKPSLKEFQKRLDKARKNLGNAKPMMKKISVFLDRWVQENFKTEGGKVGGWKELAAGGRWVRGKGLDTSAKILQDTGRGRASFTPFATRKDAGIGSDLPYMRDHDKGENGMEQRRILPEEDEVRDDVEDIVDSHVKLSFMDEGFKVD